MLLKTRLSVLWLLFFWSPTRGTETYPAPADAVLCPEPCTCGLDNRGRVTIICDSANMTDPIPVRSMDRNMEVLFITPTKGRQNSLTIGPIFKDFERLEELKITRSSIPAIGKNTFWGLRYLRMLDLSSNNISILTESNFRGLVGLEELYLNDNHIHSIPSAAFRHLTSLKRLVLRTNNISELVPRLFYGLHKLEYLDLSENRLGDLDTDVFRDVPFLKTLKCRQCGLALINPLLLHLLTDLTTLDLGENQFHYINNNAFHDLKHLKHLHLDGNLLNVVTAAALTGHNLTSLSLARNKIITLDPGCFINVTVRSLDLSHNRIQSFDPLVFVPLSGSLDRLELAGNPLQVSQIWSNVLGPRVGLALTHLDLSDIALGTDPLFTPELFASQEGLEVLNISSCSFSYLHSDIVSKIPQLRVLDLSRNLLTSMTDSVLKALSSLPSLQTIHLHENPWHCEACVIGPLLKWIDVHPAAQHIKAYCRRPVTYNDVPEDKNTSVQCPVCQGPGPLKGVELPRLDHVNLPLCNEYPPLKNPGGLPISAVRDGAYQDVDITGSRTGLARMKLLDNPLYLGLASGIAALLLIAVCSAFAIFSKHAASYYTNEEKRTPSTVSAEDDEQVHQKLYNDSDLKNTSIAIELEEESLKSFIASHKKKKAKTKNNKKCNNEHAVSRGVRCYNGNGVVQNLIMAQERVLR